MANVVLRFALSKISTFVSEQGTLLGGLGQEVQLIGDELGHIKAFLEKVEDFNQENDDPQLTEWIRQVREVSYDTEDILDEFAFLFGRRRRRSGFLGSIRRSFDSTKNLPARRRLATKLQSIKGRVKNISEARLRYETMYGNTAAPERDAWRHSKDDDALLVEEDQLVGIEEPKQHLISHLLEDGDSQFKAIAVVGMGGLGKTTLVRKVMDDAAVRRHFQICAWVAISKRCDYINLLKGLIQELLSQFNEPIPPLMDSMNIYQLKAFLKNFLRGGRYMIVFDDIWDTEFWNASKLVLPDNSYGGNRVIFTTRIAHVASACTRQSRDYVYKMGCLSFQDSWTLFCSKVFKDGRCPRNLLSVAESMVAKCEGLPLAILAIGGLLASKDTSRTNEWELIQSRLLVQSRLRDEFEGTEMFDRVTRILSLSYNDLPSTLKACLLYTDIYFKGYEISSQHLVRLLVAEGFVEPRNGQTAEEMAWDCLKELANRSLIQFHQVLYAGLHDWIHIHDLLREFIATKSRVQNMTTIITTTSQHMGWPPEKVRRLVFDRRLLRVTSPEINPYTNNFRSIIAFGEKKMVSSAALAQLLSSNLLTVLELRGIDLKKIPQKIFKLFQLRYLGVSGKGINRIPKSIKRLQNLQCFILRGTSVKELPMEIRKLHKLCHLLFEEQVTDSPEGQLVYDGFRTSCRIGALLELQTLWAIDVEKSGIVKEIGKLTKLRKLCITNLRREDGKELCTSLEKLNNLQELVVASLVKKDEAASTLDLNHHVSVASLQSLCSLGLYGPLEEIPAWIKNLQGLERITMSLSNLADDLLEALQHLPNLFEVRLTGACQRESLCFKAGGFLKLKKLTLRNMKLLRWVTIEKGAMPSIDQLTMRGLPLPEELPSGIEHLRQLQRLDLLGMSSQLINKLMNADGSNDEESEDYKNILHVPKVTIGFLFHGQWKLYPLSKGKETRLQFSAVEPSLHGYESDGSLEGKAPSRSMGMESDDSFGGRASYQRHSHSIGKPIWDSSSKPNYN